MNVFNGLQLALFLGMRHARVVIPLQDQGLDLQIQLLQPRQKSKRTLADSQRAMVIIDGCLEAHEAGNVKKGFAEGLGLAAGDVQCRKNQKQRAISISSILSSNPSVENMDLQISGQEVEEGDHVPSS